MGWQAVWCRGFNKRWHMLHGNGKEDIRERGRPPSDDGSGPDEIPKFGGLTLNRPILRRVEIRFDGVKAFTGRDPIFQ